MSIRINGSTGVSGVVGTAGTPALAGASDKLGINFQNDQVNIGINTTNGVKFDSDGNIQAVGVVTASSFSGDVTGNVTGNLTGNVTGNVTGVATGLTGSPNITVDNLTVENSVFTSISTTGEDSTKLLVNRELCTLVGVGTTAGITVTLPASPQPGWEVGVSIAGTFTDSVLGRNSSNIMGLAEDLILDLNYSTIRLVYIDSYQGWRIF
tara:strand:- start:2310 stop:2936 length:627 start_codon:yes stop_codon:yes gene_type:complete